MDASGLSWQDIADPFPEKIDDGEGRSFTFGWCIRRNNDKCMFHENHACSVYEARPWICRTYPFVLSEDRVLIYPCPGLGCEISWERAVAVAQNLLDRKNSEAADDEKIRSILQNVPIPPSFFVVIDSEGIKKCRDEVSGPGMDYFKIH